MSLFNEISEVVTDYVQNIKDVQDRYAIYRRVEVSKLTDFHEPVNESQKQIAKKAAASGMAIVMIVGLVFALFGVFGLVAGENSSRAACIAIIIFGAVILGFGIIMAVGKTEVIEGGKAAWKQTRRTGSRKKGSTSYYVSVYFDHPEKIVVPLVQTTRGDYYDIVEGTPILLIKKGFTYYARVDR